MDPELGRVKPVDEVTPRDQVELKVGVLLLLAVGVTLPPLQVGHTRLFGSSKHVLYESLGLVVSINLYANCEKIYYDLYIIYSH